MKLAFLMVTRGNPHKAAAVIEVAKSLASGKHDIKYMVGCDNDDDSTHSYFYQHYPDVETSVAERPIGLGSVWNRLCELARFPEGYRSYNADIYCPFPDDVFINLPDWDDYIVEAMQLIDNPKLRVIAWNDLRNLGQCTLPIVSRDWLDLTGKLYDDRFPFWFYDTCVDELYSFITGYRIPIFEPLQFVSKKGTTQSLRELTFWWDFYVATRKERLQRADHIREELGITLEPGRTAKWLQAWEKRDADGYRTASVIEADLGQRKPPSEQYLKAREMAYAYLNINKAITPARAGHPEAA
jgi:hypothetical protein